MKFPDSGKLRVSGLDKCVFATVVVFEQCGLKSGLVLSAFSDYSFQNRPPVSHADASSDFKEGKATCVSPSILMMITMYSVL